MFHIKAVDIPDAWFQCVYNILDEGHRYKIDKGSFEGQERIEYDFICIEILKPYSEPYDTMLPQIPFSLGIPNPVCEGYVEQYLPYLMTAEKKPGEDYTYGERLCSTWQLIDRQMECFSQIDYLMGLLKKTPNTNQAVLQIAQPSDCLLIDPPCLRHIDIRIKDNKLIFYPYFRSNDLWSGFPANLAGIAVLQKYMADSIGVEVGKMIYSSKGLHIYGYVEELVKLRSYKG